MWHYTLWYYDNIPDKPLHFWAIQFHKVNTDIAQNFN